MASELHSKNLLEKKNDNIQDLPKINQLFRKYIYLNTDKQLDKLADESPKNFFVFIVTIETASEDFDDGLSSSKYNEETCSSKLEFNNANAFKQRSGKLTTKSYSKSTQHSTGASKYESKSKIFRFIKKILSNNTNNNTLKPKKRISLEEAFLADFHYDRPNFTANTKEEIRSMQSKPLVLYDAGRSFTEYRNSEVLREIIHFGTRIENSEIAVKELIIKFIQDKAFEQELLLAISNHGRSLLEAEKRAMHLASESWIQQVKLQKEQMNNLQSTLNSVMHENRVLLEENESLTKNNEKLSSSIACLKENSGNATPTTPNLFSSCVLEDMSKNNDKLRTKVYSTLNQMKNLEDVINKLQKRNSFLEQQLLNLNSQIQNQKVMFERSKSESEVQVAKLLYELNCNTAIIRECSEAGNVIIEDLDIIEKALQPIAKKIDWDKFKKTGKTLLDLIHLCRWCINELSSELTYQHHDLSDLQQEIKVLHCQIESLNCVKQEVLLLKSKLEMAESNERNMGNALKKREEHAVKIEEKSQLLEKQLQSKDDELQNKVKLLQEKDAEIERLTKNLSSIKTDFNKLQLVAEKLSDENDALEVQVKSIAQVLTATGTGDIAKELANTQQKLIHAQSQYFAVSAENNMFIKQLENIKKERKTMTEYQKTCYEQLQSLSNDLEAKEKQVETLKEKLDSEKQTVSALQTERVRHLEERTILTAIYERLKAEISKVDELEGAVSSMNKKAGRLAMIAEYNKQLGEKLQMEVAERDVAINELQNNVKELNSFQIESTKEKVALCEELNKVFSVKEVLNTKLTAELEKNVLLDETKKEIQNNANLQLKEIQVLYNKEHTAMKNLIKDLKQVVKERDELIETNKEFEDKCDCLILEREKLMEVIRNVNQANQQNENRIVELVSNTEKLSNELHEATIDQDELRSLKDKLINLKNQNEFSSDENKKLRSLMNETQKNIERLKDELEATQKSKEVFKNTCEDLTIRNETLIRELEHQNCKISTIQEENDRLRYTMSSIHDKYSCISEENERFSQETLRLESMISDKFQTNKKSGEVTPRFIENSLDDINARDEEILVLQDKIRDLESQVIELNDLIMTVTQRRDELSNINENFEKEVDHLNQECEEYQQRILKLESILNSMETNNISVMEMELERNAFIKEMNSVKTEFQEKIAALGEKLKLSDNKYNEEQRSLSDMKMEFDSQKSAKLTLETAHRKLAMKLLTAVRHLIAEKVAREKMSQELDDNQIHNNILSKKLEEKEYAITDLERKINDFKVLSHDLKEENLKLTNNIDEANERISSLKEQLQNLEENDSQKNQLLSLKKQLDSYQKEMENLEIKADNLESTCAVLELERSEAVLRYHELNAKSQAEQSRNEELQNEMQTIVSKIMQMNENGSIAKAAYADLLVAIRNHI